MLGVMLHCQLFTTDQQVFVMVVWYVYLVPVAKFDLDYFIGSYILFFAAVLILGQGGTITFPLLGMEMLQLQPELF